MRSVSGTCGRPRHRCRSVTARFAGRGRVPGVLVRWRGRVDLLKEAPDVTELRTPPSQATHVAVGTGHRARACNTLYAIEPTSNLACRLMRATSRRTRQCRSELSAPRTSALTRGVLGFRAFGDFRLQLQDARATADARPRPERLAFHRCAPEGHERCCLTRSTLTDCGSRCHALQLAYCGRPVGR